MVDVSIHGGLLSELIWKLPQETDDSMHAPS